MKLTSDGVDQLMRTCLFADNESMEGAIRVEGIVNN
jgi:hypothetical protein